MAVRRTKSLPGGFGMIEAEFIVDVESDVATIDTTNLLMGSGVYVIDGGNTYVLDSQKTWRLM
jgi:hypothetical protein